MSVHQPRKVRITLERGRNAGHSMRAVLSELLWTARHNAAGIGPGADPAFLHQFRVACRGTRSILPRTRELYRTNLVANLAAELRWIGGESTPARDLDVFSVAFGRYTSGLAKPVRRQLRGLERAMQGQASDAAKHVRAELDGERGHDLFRIWKEVARSPGSKRRAARRPAKALARRWIRDRHRKTLRAVDALSDSSDPNTLHEARIALKKLRYLIEFYRPLFSGKRTRRVLAVVRRGQAVLGAVNDCSVHMCLIDELATGRPTLDPLTALAAGELRAEVRRQRKAQRPRVKRWRRDFLDSSKRVRSAF